MAWGETDYYSPRRAVEPAVRKRVVVAKRSEPLPAKQAPKPPVGPLIIAVSIGSQHLTVFDNGTPIATAPVSTGMRGHLTPMGVFSVIQKDRYHHSNIYSNAPMPYMQRITWSGVAMHEGVLPGYPASHGCIRMPGSFASQLWGMTQMGARVVVTPNESVPYDIDHKLLTALATKPVPPEPPAVEPPAKEPPPMAAVVPADPPAKVSNLAPATAVIAEPISTAVEPSVDGSGNPLVGGARLEQVVFKMAPAAASPVIPVAEKPADLRPALGSFAADERVPVPPVKPAAPAVRAGNLSLFVSRKEGKLFVRKGFVPLFETPITIARRDVPLGTHVFTAGRPLDGGTGVRWLAVSLVNEHPAAEPERVKGKARPPVRDEKPVRMSSEALRRSAAEALDRIELPPEVIERVAAYLAPGASLLISDQGLGGETGKETDFIVVTR